MLQFAKSVNDRITNDCMRGQMDSKMAVSVMAVLGQKLRITIWHKLMPAGPSGLSAGAIAAQLDIAPSSLSFHLQQMVRANVLALRHDGRFTFYAVKHEIVMALCTFLNSAIAEVVSESPSEPLMAYVVGLVRRPGRDWRKLVDAAIGFPVDATSQTDTDEPNRDELARQEKAAALQAINGARLSVVIGPAGTGKTTLLRAFLLASDVRDGGVLLLAQPARRASSCSAEPRGTAI